MNGKFKPGTQMGVKRSSLRRIGERYQFVKISTAGGIVKLTF
jgi:hypothetical protein